MPSLQDISATEYMLLSKNEEEHSVIEGIFYDKATHMERRKLEIGTNERLFPTDCVSFVAEGRDNIMYVALNKRTKASEPHAVEIHAYDLTSNLEIGYVCK
jgi:hypothetical protein